MEFDQVLALRKSIRSYTDEPVSKEDLAALVKAALASSVGKHNDAGYTLCVVTDRALLSAIDKEAEEKLGKPICSLRHRRSFSSARRRRPLIT
uniref:nitroreductase family protein n=1 Tax=Dialister sp. TaxID=1955814 RepID=UPI004025C67C